MKVEAVQYIVQCGPIFPVLLLFIFPFSFAFFRWAHLREIKSDCVCQCLRFVYSLLLNFFEKQNLSNRATVIVSCARTRTHAHVAKSINYHTLSSISVFAHFSRHSIQHSGHSGHAGTHANVLLCCNSVKCGMCVTDFSSIKLKLLICSAKFEMNSKKYCCD